MALDGSLMVPEAAQPFRFDGGTTGILLIHGFMGLPGELRPLGAFLADQGYTVSGPLLARHGGHPEALYKVRWTEWYESVVTAYHELESRCERIVVVGYSLGGLLGLNLAAHHPVAGVITLAAALQLAGGWQLRTLPVARFVMPWLLPYRYANFGDPHLRADLQRRIGQVDLDDPQVVQQLRTSIRIPLGAVYEVSRLAQHVRRVLPRITTPILIVQGRLDTTVLPVSAQQIMARLGSRDKTLRWFERSGHLLPNDVEQVEVRQAIGEWLAEHAG